MAAADDDTALWETTMQDGANDPLAVPLGAGTGPARWRAATLLGIGGGVGLALGVALTVGVSATYRLSTPTLSVPLPPDRDAVRLLDELNDLRHQVNRLNEERTLKDREADEAVRRALGAVASAVRARASGVAPAGPQGSPAGQATNPFAELDAEIKSLEQTQVVLNTILDLFLAKDKKPAKDRPSVKGPPKEPPAGNP
ncbi:MAG: hypothetical protein U0746_20000 [Gemmataceae bacterium]